MTASANVELVRSICTAWERGDFSSAEWAHPEIEYVSADGPEPGIWLGVAGMAEGFRPTLKAWENWRFVAQEYREIDGERVLVLTPVSARGKKSGLSVTNKGATLFHLRDGKVTRLVAYWDREGAFADLGLSPEGDAGD